MEDALANVALDLSGRPAFVFNVAFPSKKIKAFDVELIAEALRSLANAAKMNLHVNVPYGGNSHHIAEAIFKAAAKALRQAVAVDKQAGGKVPSTKGTLTE
jgi:imidazoleglycerol-phosphate dehydratase